MSPADHYTLFHQPKNSLPRIEEVWMVVSVDPEDGNEGVAAAEFQGMMLPLVAADERRLEQIIPVAEAIAKATGLTMKLVKFTRREEISEFAPA